MLLPIKLIEETQDKTIISMNDGMQVSVPKGDISRWVCGNVPETDSISALAEVIPDFDAIDQRDVIYRGELAGKKWAILNFGGKNYYGIYTESGSSVGNWFDFKVWLYTK